MAVATPASELARSVEQAARNAADRKGRIANDAAFSMNCAHRDGRDGDAMAMTKASEN
jgi:hypothetical protein